MSKVLEVARSWVGKNFRPGVPEMCMGFVREVLHSAKHPLANAVTRQAVDKLDTGYWLASSLAGRDLGQIVASVNQAGPGDILFFANTYGDWPAGTITHVGICSAPGKMVHRPTMSRPVEEVSLSGFWADTFRCALQLEPVQAANLAPIPKPPTKVKLFCKPGKMVLVANQDFSLKAGQELELEFVSMEMVDRIAVG